MAIYNIPGITTSVIDQSYIVPKTGYGRTVLLAGFSKYGSEDFMEITDIEGLDDILGKPNYRMYGLGLKYLKGSLAYGAKVLWKRLLPDDATFANSGIDKDNRIVSMSDVIDTKIISASDNKLTLFAQARGNGYNNIFIKFTPAYTLENLYANDEGDIDYKFNFLTMGIYENTSNGVRALSNNITFSLLDIDPNNGMPILDMNTGKELFIDKKIKANNNFIETFMNPTFVRDLYSNLNINEITSVPGKERVYLKDISSEITYELSVDKDEGLTLMAVKHVEGEAERYLKRIETNDDGTTTEKKYKIYVENKVLKTDKYYGDSEAQDFLYIDGVNAFYKIFINDDEQLDKEIFSFPRYELYTKLLNNTFELTMGSDGENLIINNTLNMYGPGEISKQNAKQLLIDFYSGNELIREVMYPKYDFDYIPDWTNDLDIMMKIGELADDIGFSMPILSLPLAYDYITDYKVRTEEFALNSYNSLIYSGQNNLTHYDENTGGTMMIPHSYLALLVNLRTDRDYSITEPPANRNKGALPDSKIQLSYEATSANIEKLRGVQINTIISETDGTYEIDQLTAYKKASKLSKSNIVKVIHRMRKDLPKLLKDFIQVKAIENKSGEVEKIVKNYMNKYLVTSDNIKDGLFKSIKIKSFFIEEEDTLVVSITVNPVGTIETINIPITVI